MPKSPKNPRDKPLRVAMGVRLVMLRKAKGLQQSDVAKGTGLSGSTISRIESGLQFPTLPALFRIATFLQVEPGKFLPDLEDLKLAGYKGPP